MKILALETSGEFCSVALWLDGRCLQRHQLAPASHTLHLLPACEALLAEAGMPSSALDGLAFGSGPGAFTGVRVAASAAQGIALAHDLPVLPLSSLAALAHGGWRATGHAGQLPILDARRQEVYWGGYDVQHGQARLVLAEQATPIAALMQAAGASWALVGRGVELLTHEDLAHLQPAAVAPAEFAFPQACDVAELAAPLLQRGAGLAPEAALPVYLRNAL
ncbi:MAG: tRNA (adenosine(37)-N6)-threonylcarbamoyltransferase complex dimerization subunit type 1 TsaB [Gammaproteobacteria bacterium]|nr:tRNA (adenosine(37)-N6)-threonylcarbamoyltransferase complex dimerization subunit type 1 TsaB [Gammaproteobacteria bacterium]